MDMPIRIKRSFFYFKLNVIVEIRLLAKFDYCTIHKLWIEIYEMTQIFKGDLIKFCEIFLQKSELLLVTRSNDNHSPGPVMREVSP